MRFTLIDRITDLQPGISITAIKSLSLAEEYLRDHFPLFPVMPGVLMLESMYQTGAWLLRKTDEFEHSMVVLKEARNVKFADFVEPGQVLQLAAEIQKRDGRLSWLSARGAVGATVAVSAKLVMEQFNLSDEDPAVGPTDAHLKRELKAQFDVLFQPSTSPGLVS